MNRFEEERYMAYELVERFDEFVKRIDELLDKTEDYRKIIDEERNRGFLIQQYIEPVKEILYRSRAMFHEAQRKYVS